MMAEFYFFVVGELSLSFWSAIICEHVAVSLSNKYLEPNKHYIQNSFFVSSVPEIVNKIPYASA